ncbi:MAG: hypothetical protein JXB47_19705 [Anaerolineae bacterium]|nr:hypothetical protein [Anaerolineae bacterium]
MKKPLNTILVFLALLAALLSPLTAQAQDEILILLETDFDSGALPSGLTASSGVEIISEKETLALALDDNYDPGNRVVRFEESDQVGMLTIASGESWSDYMLVFRVFVVSGQFSAQVRETDEQMGLCTYRMGILPDKKTVNLVAWAGDECDQYNTLDTQDFEFPMSKWVTLGFMVVGPQLTVFVDDQVLLSAQDDTYAGGYSRLIAWPGAEVYVDDVKVYSLSVAPSGPPETLEHYNGTYEEAIAELKSKGVIPSDGALIFTEDYAFVSATGSATNMPLASKKPAPDVVVAGELAFTPRGTGDFEACVLLHRVVSENRSITQWAGVGVDNQKRLFVIDNPGADPSSRVLLTDVNIDEPHHVLVITIGDKATVYIDGKLAIKDFPVVDRSGYYGVTLFGLGKCEGENLWAYEVWTEGAPACNITGNNVNLRAGPGTNYDSKGKLNGTVEADGQAKGADGYTWYRLIDGTWVRQDVIDWGGGCDALPTVETP